MRVIDGPTVLHASIRDQWGGHTFGYLLQGATGVFWAARPYDKGAAPPSVLVGQHPSADSSMLPHVTTLSVDEPGIRNWNQPQMVRSPDGHLHVFIGVERATDNPNVGSGRIRYFRSERPEDISSLVDRTELLPPTPPFEDYHLRMNVGISRDGSRVALVILAVSPTGAFAFNTPVLLVGEREGLDYVFRPPIQYAEAMGLFYPQVAATEFGVVIVGQVWDDTGGKVFTTRLLHVSWDGALLHREDFPATEPGQHFVSDMRPREADDWTRLFLYRSRVPDTQLTGAHEFWGYNSVARKLRLIRSLDVPYGEVNAGRWLPASDRHSVFVNNPSMGRIRFWEGDILGGGPVSQRNEPAVDVLRLGYQATSYLFAPNPLHGSIYTPGDVVIAADAFNPSKASGEPGPNSLLMWRLDLDNAAAPAR
jgi:hypothetical protein